MEPSSPSDDRHATRMPSTDAVGPRDAPPTKSTAGHPPHTAAYVEGLPADSRPTSQIDPAWLNGRYEILALIARGGMGDVYRAIDHTFDREIAVKVLQERLAHSALAGRFLGEAKITGRLQHPGIPPCHDLGILPDGRPFLAIKLIRGETLTEHLAAATMDWTAPRTDPADRRRWLPDPRQYARQVRAKMTEVLYWRLDRIWEGPTPSELTDANPPELMRLLGLFERICQTVAYAHSQGVIHRDLKPTNVMIGAFGEVQVMDWGLAKHLAESESAVTPEGNPQLTPDALADTDDGARTIAGSPLGTPSYMPPEQARGQLERVDKRSDVFSLGAILCEILTGKPPFMGDTLEKLTCAAEGDLHEAFERLDVAQVEGELVSLAKQCLAPDPADRPADGKAVADTITSFVEEFTDRLKRAHLRKIQREVKESGRKTSAGLGLSGAAVMMAVLGFSRSADFKSLFTKAPEPNSAAIWKQTQDQMLLGALRRKLLQGGPSGERIANLPDQILLEVFHEHLTWDDVGLMATLQERLKARNAQKASQPDENKDAPAKDVPAKIVPAKVDPP